MPGLAPTKGEKARVPQPSTWAVFLEEGEPGRDGEKLKAIYGFSNAKVTVDILAR